MLRTITLVAIAALAAAVTTTPQPAFAHDGGAVAAGVIGGLAVGAVVGSQIDRDRSYRRHYGDCRIERQEVTDRYGNEHFRRVRVCD